MVRWRWATFYKNRFVIAVSQKHEDLTLLSVRSAFDHLQSTVNRALQRIERQAQLSKAELFNEIKERRKLAKVLMLDQRLIRLYKALTETPSLKIERGQGLVHAELSSSIVTTENGQTRVAFKINDKDYTLVLADVGGGCISYYGETFKSAHLSLLNEEQEAVLTVHLNLKGDETEEQVSESQITAFIPDKWIYDIIHAYETLVTSEKLEAINEAFSDERIEQLKQRFGIE